MTPPEATNEPSERPARRAFIKSFGCQMNAYDALRMSDALAAKGFVEASGPEDADLVILNTCHIRERAAEKVFSELGRLAALKAERRMRGEAALIAVAGCVAQAEGAEIVRRQPAVDLVIGPQAYHRLPTLLDEAVHAPGRVDTSFPDEDKLEAIPAPSREAMRKRGVTSFITIQEGCDKFCSFCVVPYTRGAEASRGPESILEEARRHAGAGVRDICLLGQNVNAYGGRDLAGRLWSLARLMEAAAAIPGVCRIRYTTSHPKDMTAELIDAHRTIPAVMPFLHLPVQAGADRILKAMNRRHTIADYLETVERVRAARPDIAISSDFIVGFPGETDSEFEQTLELAEKVGFAQSYSFKYSPRPGTPAADAPDQIPEPGKKSRLALLQAVLESSRQAFNSGSVGTVQDVLIERPGRHDGQIAGRTPYMQAVHAKGTLDLIGSIQRVEILGAGPNSLYGALLPRDGSTA